ncbi:GNAT family N-acetyltransferase [Larsenimonas rhizosphaerae]|uniref:GNAT family N-acetyltransferase n=1 Tax=Larsenimonas rhizosphaerae TaxID=2944682 RepID=A0AA42CWJ1_9GAMM|nr:GNAT family N-acetyltransferase [Larsenimonas rhizosphaerae]MCM2129966.1 GNAT family N-acetyltransferase [Larsenimonas rhizosphaerae]MCX2522665.1 GNAT family N-acetyltransferase [Larsenimonas rhizosphaerae]
MTWEHGRCSGLTLRPTTAEDRDAVLAILLPILATGETYALPRDMTDDEAWHYWFTLAEGCWVAEQEGTVVGCYYLRSNARGGGDHVCNCGYIVAPEARGQGVAATLCQHSLKQARSHGFRAMQFNCVVSTNEGAVRLWQRHGFDIVGRLPGAFHHPGHGYVDALVMYQDLQAP